jgi:hypothetical protein
MPKVSVLRDRRRAGWKSIGRGLVDWFRRRRFTSEHEARLAGITNPQQRAALLKALAEGDVIPKYAWDPLPTEFDTFALLPRAPQVAASSRPPIEMVEQTRA